MHVLGHYDSRMKMKADSISVQTAIENYGAAMLRQRSAYAFSKTDEDSAVRLLKMRQPPAILIFVCEHLSNCFRTVGRRL